MKVSTEAPVLPESPPQQVRLPEGLVGFPDHTGFELLYNPEQLPFRWMRLLGGEPVDFVVIEPAGIVADYEIELFDEDASFLGISDAADALILNIVTVSRSVPPTATVNLVGPVVVNRRTGVAKQVVIANHGRYSARHPLVTN
ncbi:MAG: flagellar assembly protein FliW [Opitutaceae bacterium]|nr:flagellar assembly protein FliW [Opitutaceae bacterium]